MKPIVLITPTGGRPTQLKNCVSYMKEQTYKGSVVWIVVDDCVPSVTDIVPDDFRDNWSIIKVFPQPIWKPGDNTQGRNLLAGLEFARGVDCQAIFIIEDDDFYTPKYLETMTLLLEGHDIAGEIETVYYNVNLKREHKNKNTRHSSLFQTVFTPRMIDVFCKVITMNVKYYDIELFKTTDNVQFIRELNLSVGIKGLPGRGGIGNGHNGNMYYRNEHVLPTKLRNRIESIYNEKQ